MQGGHHIRAVVMSAEDPGSPLIKGGHDNRADVVSSLLLERTWIARLPTLPICRYSVR